MTTYYSLFPADRTCRSAARSQEPLRGAAQPLPGGRRAQAQHERAAGRGPGTHQQF